MTSARQRRRRQTRASAPRMIGANDNAPGIANDNAPLVVSGHTLNEGQAKRFRAALADEASPELHRRRAGREAMLRLESEIAAVANTARVANDIEETVELEKLRGSIIETSDRKEHEGRKRITSRDGLETISAIRLERKTGRPIPPLLSSVQYAAGLRYRPDYEALDPQKGLTPPSIDQSRSIVRGGDGYASKLKEISQRIELVDRMIFGLPLDLTRKVAMPNLPKNHPDMRAAWIIREVAGKGENLFNVSTSGSDRFRNSEALKRALDCAAIVYGLE